MIRIIKVWSLSTQWLFKNILKRKKVKTIIKIKIENIDAKSNCWITSLK